jgi:hypothetical protein
LRTVGHGVFFYRLLQAYLEVDDERMPRIN